MPPRALIHRNQRQWPESRRRNRRANPLAARATPHGGLTYCDLKQIVLILINAEVKVDWAMCIVQGRAPRDVESYSRRFERINPLNL